VHNCLWFTPRPLRTESPLICFIFMTMIGIFSFQAFCDYNSVTNACRNWRGDAITTRYETGHIGTNLKLLRCYLFTYVPGKVIYYRAPYFSDICPLPSHPSWPHGSTPRFLFGGAVFLPAKRFTISTIQKPVIGVMSQWIKRLRAELFCLWMQALALVRSLSCLTKFG